MDNAVIISGGGFGQRMGLSVPKQFIEIVSKPLIAHTIELFFQFDPDILMVIVIPDGFEEVWKKIHYKYFPGKNILFTYGGETRFESVKNGLSLLNGKMIIGVHDAVRPMVSLSVISRCYELAAEKGSAVPVIPVNESLRQDEGIKNFAVSRENLRIVQTPQVFAGNILINAYSQAYNTDFTDDSTVVEKYGAPIFLTPGDPENIKITKPFDLKIAEAYLRNI